MRSGMPPVCSWKNPTVTRSGENNACAGPIISRLNSKLEPEYGTTSRQSATSKICGCPRTVRSESALGWVCRWIKSPPDVFSLPMAARIAEKKEPGRKVMAGVVVQRLPAHSCSDARNSDERVPARQQLIENSSARLDTGVLGPLSSPTLPEHAFKLVEAGSWFSDEDAKDRTKH